MVRGARILERAAALALALAALAVSGCPKKKEAAPGRALEQILRSEPNVRARSLRAEIEGLSRSGKLDQAAARIEAMQKAVGDILTAMDAIHHRKTAVPDFDVVRYVEALRDLGETLRGFQQLWSAKNPDQLKREMLEGLLGQLQTKIR
jgi:hypothetical protein